MKGCAAQLEHDVLLPPQGFGPEESPGLYIQGQRIFVDKVRNVFVMGEAFSI